MGRHNRLSCAQRSRIGGITIDAPLGGRFRKIVRPVPCDFSGGNVIEKRPQQAESDTVWRRLRGAAMRLAARLI